MIRTITYTELRELSYMGASVLHEAAIFPVRSAGIPINIRNTNAPDEPGTMIVPDSIETEDGIALIAVVGRGMCRTRGVAARIFAALAHAHINVRMIDQGSSELNVIVAVKETDFEQAIRCIYEMFVNSVA